MGNDAPGSPFLCAKTHLYSDKAALAQDVSKPDFCPVRHRPVVPMTTRRIAQKEKVAR